MKQMPKKHKNKPIQRCRACSSGHEPHICLEFGKDCKNVDTAITLRGCTEAIANWHQMRETGKRKKQSIRYVRAMTR